MIVKGAGAGSTIVDGNQAGSAFIIGKNNPNVDVDLSDMTITSGSGNIDPDDYYYSKGGGIYHYGGGTTGADSTIGIIGILNLDQVIITDNTADYGGGIYNTGTA